MGMEGTTAGTPMLARLPLKLSAHVFFASRSFSLVAQHIWSHSQLLQPKSTHSILSPFRASSAASARPGDAIFFTPTSPDVWPFSSVLLRHPIASRQLLTAPIFVRRTAWPPCQTLSVLLD